MSDYISDNVGASNLSRRLSVLQNRIKKLEESLAALLNPFSSKYGTLVHIENDKVFYRIEGKFVPYEEIVEALERYRDNS